MKKISIIVGARPNFMKASPVFCALNNKEKFNLEIIHSGQHYDKNMSDIFFQELGLPQPSINLNVSKASELTQTANIMLRLEEYYINNGIPDLIIVFGDVTSSCAGAFVGIKLNVPIAHVEAGNRSFDNSIIP